MNDFILGIKLGKVYLDLKQRQYRRECKRQLNIRQGLCAIRSKKGSLHSDIDIAIELIEKLIVKIESNK